MTQRIQAGTVYSVEMSGGRVTVARAVRRRGRVMHEVLVRDIDPATDAAWLPLAQRIAREQQKGSAMLAGIVLARDSFMRTLEVPFSSLAKARAVLPSRLDVELPVPVERCACAFVHLNRLTGSAGARAIAVAVPEERLATTLAELQSVELNPEWMEQEALVLWRMAGAEQGGADAAEPGVVLYLASDHVVAVAGREGSPFSAFSAKLAWGGDDASRARVLARLRPFLAGVTREPGMENPQFLVAGALAREHADALRVALEVKPEAWRVCAHPETGLVRALALSALSGDSWSGNLRTGKAMHPNLGRLLQRQIRRAAAWVAAGAAALLLASTASSWLAQSKQRAWQELVQQSAREITGMASVPRGMEEIVVRQHVEEARASGEIASLWLSPGAYPLFSQLLRVAHVREVELESMSVGPARVVLRGRSTSASEAGHLSVWLEQEGWTSDVEAGGVDEGGRFVFTVRGERAP
jgi:hypothetical protein